MESKTAKGTRDYIPDEESIRQELIKECEKVFLLYDAKRIDTPTIELLDILLAKYNNDENAKEIFVLKNKKEEGEQTGLRYDLTVPFSRFVRDNGIKKMRKYQIGKVFRRDKPSPGRYREFYQCDYDLLGCDNLIGDIETLLMLNSILKNIKEKFNTPEYMIKINSKVLLYEILKKCNVKETSYNRVCSLIDKLDKIKWEDIELDLKAEMEDTGLLRSYIEDKKTCQNLDSYEQLDNMVNLLKNTEKDIPVKIDTSLARGLNYYTGNIFEVVFVKKGKSISSSIAGGGRYDELCQIPCIGFSIGIDRIFSFIKNYKTKNTTRVWLISISGKNDDDNSLFLYRLKILNYLRNIGISCGTEMEEKMQVKKNITYALKNEIPYVIFVGNTEMQDSSVTLKILSENKEIKCPLEDIRKYISNK